MTRRHFPQQGSNLQQRLCGNRKAHSLSATPEISVVPWNMTSCRLTGVHWIINYLALIPRSRILLDILIVLHLVKKTLCILLNPKFHHRIHNSPPFITIPGHVNPVHASHHFNIILSFTLSSPIWSLTFSFPHQNPYSCIFFSIHAATPPHPLNPFSLILFTRIVAMGDTKHEVPQYAVFSSLLLSPFP